MLGLHKGWASVLLLPYPQVDTLPVLASVTHQ